MDDEREPTVGVHRLDDADYPALTMGQAAEVLGVQPAFLRSLDAADVVQPMRSAGGHRRYSRRQLEFAARMRALFDDGITLEAAYRIVRLEDEWPAAASPNWKTSTAATARPSRRLRSLAAKRPD
jgi:MerR family transcriptional regulator, heat shock protein HspR